MLWYPKEFEKVDVTFDYTSSGMGKFESTALKIDNELFASPLPKIEFEDSNAQLILCSSCGMDGCEIGNWVSVRKINQFLALIPCFSFLSPDEFELNNYAPPKSMNKNGIPLFSEKIFPFTIKEPICSISFQEIALTFQWFSPKKALYSYPKLPSLKPEQFICSLDHDLHIILEYFETTIQTLYSNQKPKIRDEFTNSVLVFDSPTHTEWAPFETLHLLCG